MASPAECFRIGTDFMRSLSIAIERLEPPEAYRNKRHEVEYAADYVTDARNILSIGINRGCLTAEQMFHYDTMLQVPDPENIGNESIILFLAGMYEQLRNQFRMTPSL